MADNAMGRFKQMFQGVCAAFREPDAAAESAGPLPALQSFIHFWTLTIRSFIRNRVPVRASALAYSSLLALVPMLALILSIALGFLRGAEGEKHIETFIQHIFHAVLPSAEGTVEAQKETVKKIKDFVTQQQTSAVSASAALMLVFIAIMMLSRIEDTFNDIWGVSRGRSWFARVTQYWATLTLGPVLLVMVIGLTSSTELAGFKAVLAEMPLGIGVLTSFFFKFLPYLLLSLGFAVLYVLLPNTKVTWRAALVGGIVGGCLWQLNNLMSVLYVSRVVSNSKVYGSLGMVPVVMIGLYFSWLILLFGAQVAYSFQNRRAYYQERLVENLDQHTRELAGLRLMVEIARRFHAGQKAPTGILLSELLGVPTRLTGKVLQALTNARLIVEVNQGDQAYVPARPLEEITCHQVLEALRTSGTGPLALRESPAREHVRDAYESFQLAEQAVSGKLTLASLVAARLGGS
jgi:membrane protein